MARVNGPLLSIEASGSVAGLLTWLNSPTGPNVRRLARQRNVYSAAKQSHRIMFSFLQRAWSTLSPSEQASWEPIAIEANYTPQNAFTSFNLNRWSQGETPLVTP